jgi:hypothetical protein
MSEFINSVKQITANISNDPIQAELDASLNIDAAKNWAITGAGTAALTLAILESGVEPAAIVVGSAGAAKCVYHWFQFANSSRHVLGNVWGKVLSDLTAPEAPDDQDL